MMETALLILSALVGCHGLPKDDKIVGGSVVKDIHEVPYMTSIYLKDPAVSQKDAIWYPYTAGTILSALYVVTACQNVAEMDEDGDVTSMVSSYPLKNWQFVAGCLDVSSNRSAQFRTPLTIRFHPKCQLDPFLYNDVAVAKMSEPFLLNDYVKPVKFFGFDPTTFEAKADKIIASQGPGKRPSPSTCVISGWGSTQRISILEHFGGRPEAEESSEEEKGNTPGVKIPDIDIVEVFSAFGATVRKQINDSDDDTGYGKLEPSLHRVKGEDLRILQVYPMHDVECLSKMIKSLKEGMDDSKDTKLKKEALLTDYKHILHQQICAISKFGNESSCHGDPGSGLVCDGYLIGVVSWSIGCGTSAPEVIQSLSGVLSWMKDEVCTLRHYNDSDYLLPECSGKRSGRDNVTSSKYEAQHPGTGRSAVKTISPWWLGILLQILAPISLQYRCS